MNIRTDRCPQWDGRRDTFAAWKEAHDAWEAAWRKHHARKANRVTRVAPLKERYRNAVRDAAADAARQMLPGVTIDVSYGDRRHVSYLGGRLCVIGLTDGIGPRAVREWVKGQLGSAPRMDRGLVQSLDYLRRRVTQ